MTLWKAALAVTAAMGALANAAPPDDAVLQAQPVVDAFFSAVVACGREPPFKPSIGLAATAAGTTRYDHADRAIILVPYGVLDPERRAAMARFAAIGTLGLSGRAQYVEIFNNLLVAHELGHWVQEMSRRPLNRWQAEYQANRMMVAFWRDHPGAVPTARRLANFVARRPGAPGPMPAGTDMSPEAYFNANIAAIEAAPARYASFQKMMVTMAMAENPRPSFCQAIAAAWPAA